MDLDGTPARRRRGTELEHALLEAAWAELTEHGYAGLTIDAVAQRAGTSRPVLYRRWATKVELVEAALAHEGRRDRLAVPDTGTLRGDVLWMMRYANEKRIGLAGVLVAQLYDYFQETGRSPMEMRELVLGDAVSTIDVVVDRAVARGEVRAERMTPRVRRVASDLFRHEALMRLRPVPDDVLVEIVDEVFLPLVTRP